MQLFMSLSKLGNVEIVHTVQFSIGLSELGNVVPVHDELDAVARRDEQPIGRLEIEIVQS